MPRIARPPLTTSSVVTALASRAGLRYVLPVTSVESWMVLVALARAPSAVYASSMGWSGVPIMGS
ncbi:Uncharacterised protein [Mycobacteroides abscessus subsp. abscessus]|nr:Uncharacterised protein [Mycobacteroides abscessus subsp. abscessus]SLC92825.1 Uncharacterised protein [Mycobacteroides abscessus subsp. massiliense]SHT29417.1 Uncharacterised protein [Mycobacteroides abscessus subsp. abscessus]SHV40815.1 Uncharacterised protein [Mycobacteroides abscessus subsp. abscessus]SIL23999.1 Uncharacterised protein [Mycobacteroides abscessus subsp. abscessus]